MTHPEGPWLVRALSIALLAAYLLHVLLTGKVWLWNLLSVIPPLLFALVPLPLLAWAARRRDRIAAACAFAVLLLGLTQSDINWQALRRGAQPAPADTISVFTWNTRFWNEEGDPEFYAHIRAQDADIIQLQEYWDRRGAGLDLEDELRREFPGYELAVMDELVTLSRLPVVGRTGSAEDRYLRIDALASGKAVSFYNVHVSMQLGGDMAGIFRERAEQLAALEANLASNLNPALIAGDFNSTTSMGVLRPLARGRVDSIRASDEFLPVTWGHHALSWLRLWRLDFTFLDPELRPVAHEKIDPRGMSDHDGMLVRFAP